MMCSDRWFIKIFFILANNANPDIMQPCAAFHLGIHCLEVPVYQYPELKWLFLLSFSAEVFKTTFKSLSNHSPEVLYPIPDFTSFNLPVDESSNDLIPKQKKSVFLSINRYERKKNLGLALQALSKYYSHIY